MKVPAERMEKSELDCDGAASVIEILGDDFNRPTLDVEYMKELPERKKRRIGFEPWELRRAGLTKSECAPCTERADQQS